MSHDLNDVLLPRACAGCDYALGMEDRTISDYQITASSYYTSTSIMAPPYRARLNDAGVLGLEYPYWQDPNPPDNWIQVDLLVVHTVASLALQGAPGASHYVQTFKLAHSLDLDTWTYYSTAGGSSVSLNTIFMYFVR